VGFGSAGCVRVCCGCGVGGCGRGEVGAGVVCRVWAGVYVGDSVGGVR
jgi:hypothetical protein